MVEANLKEASSNSELLVKRNRPLNNGFILSLISSYKVSRHEVRTTQ